ncbi:hypothetical protein HanHA300_Chr02g0045471 [Helianthus annuus]|nr:hypothetical protein HanHA300_Chr02g0045471 [Helianthus annuus]KAJ0618076.1 hypothetical protein HanHA89_Chr02g0049111 [Helianthus annuus]
MDVRARRSPHQHSSTLEWQSPVGFDNPIPAYAGSAAYNPFELPAHTHYNYADVDPYQEAWDYNASHPEGPYGGL